VTRAIAGLEAQLGVRLFTRTTRAVGLTDAGRRHLETARQLVTGFAALESYAATERTQVSGHLTVAASVVFGRLHVRPLVTEFLRRHPDVDLRLELADRVTAVVDEGIDVAIRIGTLRDSTLRAVRTGSVRRAIYASPTYLAARDPPRVPADLARHVCVAFAGTTPQPTRWTFAAGRRRTTVLVKPRLVTNAADVAIDAALAGFGVICVLSYMVDHLVAAGSLSPLLVEHELPALPVHVVYPAGRHVPPPTRAFVDHATAALRTRFGAAPIGRVPRGAAR
jgi:DNA-binding transcriptional LysR family regulator